MCLCTCLDSCWWLRIPLNYQLVLLLNYFFQSAIKDRETLHNKMILTNVNLCLIIWHFCDKVSMMKMKKTQERPFYWMIKPILFFLSLLNEGSHLIVVFFILDFTTENQMYCTVIIWYLYEEYFNIIVFEFSNLMIISWMLENLAPLTLFHLWKWPNQNIFMILMAIITGWGMVYVDNALR